MIYIREDFQMRLNQQEDYFDQLMAMEGATYRKLENRQTLRFELGGNSYFIKQHFGVGWREIFKNLFQLRWPIVSAKNEWKAIQWLVKLHIPSMQLVAYGKRGWNPATVRSFMVTEALLDVVTLEDLGQQWQAHKPSFQFKQALIREVAEISKRIHQYGMNHRDFYICHFLIKKNKIENLMGEGLHLILMDLHRAQIRRSVPKRWRIKDIAGLYFSSMDVGLTRRDVFRFLKYYFNRPLRDIIQCEKQFLAQVNDRALKLYFKTFKRLPGK